MELLDRLRKYEDSMKTQPLIVPTALINSEPKFSQLVALVFATNDDSSNITTTTASTTTTSISTINNQAMENC